MIDTIMTLYMYMYIDVPFIAETFKFIIDNIYSR